MNHPPSHRPHQLAAGITTAAGLAAAAALTLLGAPPAAAAAAADTAPPQLGRVTFSRAAVNVSGLNVVPVTVSVRLSDPSGISEIPQAMTPSPHLTLGPVPGFRSQLQPVLTRTSGSSTDGVWSATVGVPSTWNGVVRVTSVGATDGAGNVFYADRTRTRTPALRVRGTHRPALTFRYETLPGGGTRVSGRATFTDTGRPIAKLPLATGYDSNCDFEGGAIANIVTDARGRYQRRWPSGARDAAACVAIPGRATPGQAPTLIAYRYATKPSPTVPDAAMLQPKDLGGSSLSPVTDEYWAAWRPPQPCTTGTYPSAGLRRADRAVAGMIGVDGRPTVLMEDVAIYQGNGAHRYLLDLRRALQACGGVDAAGERWTVLARGVAGDESLLLRHRQYLDYAGVNKDTYVVVARTGRALVVLGDFGWETGNGHQQLVRKLAVAAVRRAAVLR